MQTLEASLSALVSHGLITYEEAISRAILPKEIRPMGIPQQAMAVAALAPETPPGVV